MGLLAPLAEFILWEHAYKKITGNVCFIGRQTVFLTEETLGLLLGKFRLDNIAPGKVEYDEQTLGVKGWGEGQKLITDRYFMKALGVPALQFLDVSDYEGADIIHDLGQPIPKRYQQRYDFIYNGGCLDNMFNPGVGLINMAKMLKPGGRIVCMESAGSWNNPYLIFSPAWFYDYFVANGFVDVKVYIAMYNDNEQLKWGPWALSYMDLVCDRNGPSPEATNDKHLLLAVIAEKGSKSSSDIQPLQHQYRDDPKLIDDVKRKEELVWQSQRKVILTADQPIKLGVKYENYLGQLGQGLHPGVLAHV